MNNPETQNVKTRQKEKQCFLMDGEKQRPGTGMKAKETRPTGRHGERWINGRPLDI